MALCSKAVGAALPCTYAALLCASPWPSLLGSASFCAPWNRSRAPWGLWEKELCKHLWPGVRVEAVGTGPALASLSQSSRCRMR